MKNIMMGTYIYNDESYNFNFGTNLSAYDKTIFVRTVVETLVDDTNYDSVLREIIFDYTVISMLTDIDTSFFKTVDGDGNMIADINLIEQFLEETNVVDIVKANMKVGLLEQLENAVNKLIEYRTGIHPSPIADSLANLINTIEKKIGEIDLGNAMDMVQKFAGMTGGFTPESIVNAYLGSDMHKKNLEEIAESKKNEIKIDEDLGEVIRTVVEENKVENTDETEG